MQTMYPGKVNSPITELASAIDNTQTSITVLDGSALPAAPNLATIGQGDVAETILYGAKAGNVLSSITRGYQGTARAWAAGIKLARNFTEADYAALTSNISELDGEVSGATPVATPSTLVKRDANGRMKAAAPMAADDVARKAEIDDLKLSVSDGKTVVAAAITGKGVPTAATAPFQTMADNINSIVTGSLKANGTSQSVFSENFVKISVRGLSFRPKFIIAQTSAFAGMVFEFINTMAVISEDNLSNAEVVNKFPSVSSSGILSMSRITAQGTSSNMFLIVDDGFDIVVAGTTKTTVKSVPWLAYG